MLHGEKYTKDFSRVSKILYLQKNELDKVSRLGSFNYICYTGQRQHLLTKQAEYQLSTLFCNIGFIDNRT